MAARKRVHGRFAREGEPGVEAEAREREAKGRVTLRPRQCRDFARKRMAEALPEIVERFIREAKLGSIPHARALSALGGLDRPDPPVPRARRHRPGLTEMLLEELKRGRATDGESHSEDVTGERAKEA